MHSDRDHSTSPLPLEAHAGLKDLKVEKLLVTEGSRVVGQSPRTLDLAETRGISILAIRRQESPRPPPRGYCIYRGRLGLLHWQRSGPAKHHPLVRCRQSSPGSGRPWLSLFDIRFPQEKAEQSTQLLDSGATSNRSSGIRFPQKYRYQTVRCRFAAGQTELPLFASSFFGGPPASVAGPASLPFSTAYQDSCLVRQLRRIPRFFQDTVQFQPRTSPTARDTFSNLPTRSFFDRTNKSGPGQPKNSPSPSEFF